MGWGSSAQAGRLCVWGAGAGRGWRRGLVGRGLVGAPRWFLLLAVPGRLFCFGSLLILDVARCGLWLFALCVDVEIGGGGC